MMTSSSAGNEHGDPIAENDDDQDREAGRGAIPDADAAGSNQRSGSAGQSGAPTAHSVATGGTGSTETADAVEQSGDPGARGGYGEAVPGGTASRLAGEPSGTTATRPAEPFDADGEPFDEDP